MKPSLLVRAALLAGVTIVCVGCSFTSRTARPETPSNLVCVEGHDVQLQNGDGKYVGGIDFVCTKYLPKGWPSPSPTATPTKPSSSSPEGNHG